MTQRKQPVHKSNTRIHKDIVWGKPGIGVSKPIYTSDMSKVTVYDNISQLGVLNGQIFT